jgi:hypothetical protein
MGYQLVQLVYWLSLSTLLGSVLFVLLAAPSVFRTIRENNPILSHVLSVNMEGQHSTLLAGAVVTGLLQRLLRVELVCGGLLLVTLIVQPFVIDLSSAGAGSAVVRAVLFLAAGGVAFYDWQYVWPKVNASRAEYIDHADEPDVANPALDRFNAAQRLNLNLTVVVASLVLGMVLFSVAIVPQATYSVPQPSRASK